MIKDHKTISASCLSPEQAYACLVQHSQETAYLKTLSRLLAWDQRTCLPSQGHNFRHQQRAFLARLIHRRQTDPALGEYLAKVEASPLAATPEGDVAVNLREWRRAWERAVRIPEELAVALTKAASAGESVWEATRPANDWESFRPYLGRTVRLQREKAEALGYAGEPFDALLADFEPGETAATLSPLFSELQRFLLPFLEKIMATPKRPANPLRGRSFPRPAQESLARHVAVRLGFDFEAGRLDVSAHPFATGLGPADVRFTTRYDEHYFGPALFSVLHEIGHALYEQGLPAEHWGTPRGTAVSLGIHESQSRLWENLVGRSLAFWQHFYPLLQKTFPSLPDLGLQDWQLAVNEVQPGLIRTEADEVTYNLHIILRFDLERALVNGRLQVDDLPEAWNEGMRNLLGLTPPDFRHGVMQDVHWAAGLFGYFPTYTLGNLYAAQFFAQAQNEVSGLEELMAAGDFRPLLAWLRQNIHQHGSRFRPRQLVARVTGHELQTRFLLTYLEKKFTALR